MGRLASADAVMRVAATNAEFDLLVFRGDDPAPGGFQATLLLNKAGSRALLDG